MSTSPATREKLLALSSEIERQEFLLDEKKQKTINEELKVKWLNVEYKKMVKVMDDKQVQIDEADTKLSKIKTSTKTAQKKLKEVNEDIEKRGKSRQEFVTLFQAEKKELIGSRDRELSFLIEETEVKKKECREIDAHTKELRKDQEKLEKAVWVLTEEQTSLSKDVHLLEKRKKSVTKEIGQIENRLVKVRVELEQAIVDLQKTKKANESVKSETRMLKTYKKK